MSVFARHNLVSLDEYLAAERSSPLRYEFCDGQVFLMAGGSPRHNFLETRLLQLIGSALTDSSRFAMTSNQRLSTADELYTYADGSIFCGDLEVGEDQTATNPVVVIEVLSDSTRDYDRGEKLRRYQTIPSLRHVVLLEQDAIDVEVWTRTDAGWQRCVYVDDQDEVTLSGIGVVLRAGDIYEGAFRLPN
ncbi:MAG: Uma2 family endonuclease [Myxococcota bacterium]